ncbi:MAG: thioredoxin domain-containing protein, partial [Gammaproteobacteria bacterium]|nr:thioredoxin domain-containing protein [Gammaproteobacteria bacterium]
MESRNRLADETSPYLLQHADNPVDWYPWSEEAFERARAENKPILLSIGYSACHWCHVMAHESFEDEQIAAVMNEHFVNIKVDREERPDIDKIYQLAHQLLSQRGGGWPLTVFIDPQDQLPFFAGTYFPSEPRHGMPGFTDVMHRVATFYNEHRDEIDAQKDSMRDVFQRIDATEATDNTLDDTPAEAIRRELEQHFDARHGGFGGAPKFPHPASLERLLEHWAASRVVASEVGTEVPPTRAAHAGGGDVRALHMAAFTLEKMIRGGLYDHIGGGFYRYSVDGQWMIPHFEKMLYDNGPLLGVCAGLYRASDNELFAHAANETADWIQREMQAPGGGFYSTIDADSEGEEGKFYVWSAEQVREVIGEEAFAEIGPYFGLDQPPNFEGHHHLHVAGDQAIARDVLDKARCQLFGEREKRVRPGRDDKILTSWNAMTIRGMAIASRNLGNADYADTAGTALDFLHENLWVDGRLLATYKDGRARFAGYLDDHAHLADAIVELLQCRWRTSDLLWAVELAELLLRHFEDEDSGGFFFTADDHEQLFHRTRSFTDDATPNGNGTAIRALTRLGYLLGENRYLDAAERALRAAWAGMRQTPSAHATMISALNEFIDPPEIMVIR